MRNSFSPTQREEPDSDRRQFVGYWACRRRTLPSAAEERRLKHYTSTVMTKVESLEREVEQLAPAELAAFRAWFVEHDWQAWDRELEQDVAAGRLDHLADEALAEFERGDTTEL